ncbi:hypothetical protein BCR36DRAFT_411787 [Piromyces finnis]|uniref:Uncharacterized protein n=1 Tax=Piromyces finnis TaxID=1754191 RepID=A0A1Y1VC37_9FUNG|nr:hypothetical protein BCR36DRAFT_411787 [Piromyces finnis]|eukprot:ORX51826.1 hypothetical protein BCR36DRAFT_411787 [Piromyces finnis]
MNVVYNKRDYILPFKKYLNKPKKSVSFEQKVDFEYTYGKNDYDRKPIENVEQVTLRELYELTLSRIEARKSNVYYSNQVPKDDASDFIDYLNNNSITEEKKMNMFSKVEQEKINNMEVDELEGKSKNVKKIKLDFNKANSTLDSEEKQEGKSESLTNEANDSSVQHSNSNRSLEDNLEESNNNNNNNSGKTNPVKSVVVPFIESDDTEEITEETTNNKQQALTETCINTLPDEERVDSPKESKNFENQSKEVDVNRPPQGGRNVFLPNGDINFNNLPDTFISPKRLDSKNRRGSGSGINNPLDLAHYKPPIKSLDEINDPNYEKNVGHEPIPYGSHVVYEEPGLTSPNLEHAIPLYHRPQINYRNNLINMTYSNGYPVGSHPSSTETNEEISPKTNGNKVQEDEKKKEKKNNRKSLSFLHILKKSKSADNIKGKARMSLFKPATKMNSTPISTNTLNLNNENKKFASSPSPPLSSSSHIPSTNQDNVETNAKSSTKSNLSRISIVNNFQEPTINDLVSDGPALFNNENKTLSKYALKTLKLRQSDSQLRINTTSLQIPSSPSNLRKSPLSARSNHSSHSSHSNPNHTMTQKPINTTYVPNIALD